MIECSCGVVTSGQVEAAMGDAYILLGSPAECITPGRLAGCTKMLLHERHHSDGGAAACNRCMKTMVDKARAFLQERGGQAAEGGNGSAASACACTGNGVACKCHRNRA